MLQFILHMYDFILFCVAFSLFHHTCSSHAVYFIYKFLHPEFGSQCCKCTLTEPPAPKMHMHMPSTANAFWGQKRESLFMQNFAYHLCYYATRKRHHIAIPLSYNSRVRKCIISLMLYLLTSKLHCSFNKIGTRSL